MRLGGCVKSTRRLRVGKRESDSLHLRALPRRGWRLERVLSSSSWLKSELVLGNELTIKTRSRVLVIHVSICISCYGCLAAS